jgi:hypothetical protein
MPGSVSPPGIFVYGKLVLPAPIVVVAVSHVPIMVMILVTVSHRISVSPAVIAMALVVIAIPIPYSDIAKVDGNSGAGSGGRCKGAWEYDQRRGQNDPFERFHVGVPF